MELIIQHIKPNLDVYLNQTNKSLKFINDQIQNENKDKFNYLLLYLDNILCNYISNYSEDLDVLHIHFDSNFTDDEKLLFAEFLLIKFFKIYQNIDTSKNERNPLIQELIISLQKKLNNLVSKCPDGASASNGGNRIWKKWTQEQKNIKSLLLFWNNLNGSCIEFKTLFNSQINYCKAIANLFEFRPFAITLQVNHNDDLKKSYILLNSNNSLNEIDIADTSIIDNLETIIQFDCERKKIMTNFNVEEIIKWNNDLGSNFKQYLIITFGKEVHSFNNIRNKIDTIRDRFKIPNEASYSILSPEIDLLLNRNIKSKIQVQFLGSETSIFWDSFLLELNIRELYELRSIKLMNIYSICISEEIKSYIINDLFSKNESCELISINTKMAILELREEDIDMLKLWLSNTLDLIINSELKSKINNKLSQSAIIILDEAIIRNAKLLNKFANALGYQKLIKFKSWSELTNDIYNAYVIVSYRDQGKFPNLYYPNLLEFEYSSKSNGTAILHNFLFANHYVWARYNILKDYHKYLDHSIRNTHFNWKELSKTIASTKPKSNFLIDWNLENEYSSTDLRETYRVKLKNQRPKTYHNSDLLIYNEINSEKTRVQRIKWFFENVDFDDTKYKIQKLDELLNDFNPAERLIDTSEQERELKIIRKQLGLENEAAGRIWKILLRNRSQQIGIECLYNEIKFIFDKSKTPLVSINHFKNSWLNVDSESLMPRGNKVFKILCEYLDLNNSYRLILYRLKNASISGKIEATKKYSSLLKDLFASGCFDLNASTKTILQSNIQQYQKNHSLDELGINPVSPLSDLITLVELIQPELKLIELETIEKLKNE